LALFNGLNVFGASSCIIGLHASGNALLAFFDQTDIMLYRRRADYFRHEFPNRDAFFPLQSFSRGPTFLIYAFNADATTISQGFAARVAKRST
jgi:hypothetical protein